MSDFTITLTRQETRELGATLRLGSLLMYARILDLDTEAWMSLNVDVATQMLAQLALFSDDETHELDLTEEHASTLIAALTKLIMFLDDATAEMGNKIVEQINTQNIARKTAD